MNNNFAQLGRYFRFVVRRERISSLIWGVCIAGSAAMFAALYPGLLPGQPEIVQMGVMMSNPAMVAMMGNVYGADQLSQASLMAQECLIWYLITIAVMNIFLINRHTRVDEEQGRLEIIRALPVGKLTGSTAVIVFALGVNILIGVATAGLLLLVNIGGTTVAGAFAYGFAISAVGFVFAGLTLLAAQLFSAANAVSGFSLGLMVLFYIMRALGDVSGSVLSVISPLGLGLKVEAFYRDAVTPILILFAEGVLITVSALLIGMVRDHGTGVIPARKGRAHASRFLRSPLGFAGRVSQGTALGWGAALFLLGASYGSVCGNIDGFVAGNELMKKVIGADGASAIIDNYVAMIFVVMSMVASVPVVLITLRMHGEEQRGRLEQIFARSVPREQLLGSFLLISLVTSVLAEFLLAIGLFLTAGGALPLDMLLKAGISYLPAIWVMGGLAVLLVGWLPKLTVLVWAVFGYTFFVMYFGRVVDVPKWIMSLTPFGNVPQLPVQEFTVVPLVVLTLIALVLAVIGVQGFKARDIG